MPMPIISHDLGLGRAFGFSARRFSLGPNRLIRLTWHFATHSQPHLTMTDNNAPAVLPDAPALSREARMEKAAQAADRAMANLSSDQQVNEVPGSPPARRESWTQKISHKLSNRYVERF